MKKYILEPLAVVFFVPAFFLLEWCDNGFKSACKELVLFFSKRPYSE